MKYAVLALAIGLLGSGVYLSFKNKARQAWALLLAGLVLVLLGFVDGRGLSQFSLTGKGIEASFEAAEPSTEQKESVKRVAFSALTTAAEVSDDKAKATRPTTGISSQVVSPEFSRYFDALGLLPTTITAAEFLRPGAVISFVEGRPHLIASPKEAFPQLATEVTDTVVPEGAFSYSFTDPSGKLRRRDTLLRCQKARTEKASSRALSTTFSSTVAREVAGREVFVVGTAVVCGMLAVKWAVADDDNSADQQTRNAEQWEYASDTPIVFGIQLLRLT